MFILVFMRAVRLTEARVLWTSVPHSETVALRD